MAFVVTVKERASLVGGRSVERGTWLANAATASGTITASKVVGVPDIGEITSSDFTSNGGTAVLKQPGATPDAINIIFTADDSGTYELIGKAV